MTAISPIKAFILLPIVLSTALGTTGAQERTSAVLENLAAIANEIRHAGIVTAADKALVADYEERQRRYEADPDDPQAREEFALAAARIQVRNSEKVEGLIGLFEVFIPALRETARLIPRAGGPASREYRNAMAGVAGALRNLPSGPVRNRLLRMIAERYRKIGSGAEDSPSSVQQTMESSEALYTQLLWTRRTLEESRLDLHGQIIELIVGDIALDGVATNIHVDLLGDRQAGAELELTEEDWTVLNELQLHAKKRP